MSCSECHRPSEAGARFCGHCGASFGARPERPTQTERSSNAAPREGSSREASPEAAGRDADPYIGRCLGDRFLIHEKLGEGGFGSVYLATQVATERRVAVKLLHPALTRDENVLARFRREGHVLCRLRDAHTVTTYDFDQTEDGTLFIAMELLEGRSLHDVFQAEAPVPWRRVVAILSQICDSLREAHESGIVHRDLKPENVYLEARPGNPEFVKVLDFGIAKVMRGDGLLGSGPQLTASGQTLGTLEYMSPEQLMGRELDGRSDIYTLGVLCYELLTGHAPFPDALGAASLISAQLKSTPEAPSRAHPPGEIPPGLDAMILRMLGKEPAFRFDDVADLKQAAETLLELAGAQRQKGGAGQREKASPVPLSGSPASSSSTPPKKSLSPSLASPSPSLASPSPWAREESGGASASTMTILAATQRRKTALWVALALLAIGFAVAALIAL